jgi:hypothetical protein
MSVEPLEHTGSLTTPGSLFSPLRYSRPVAGADVEAEVSNAAAMLRCGNNAPGPLCEGPAGYGNGPDGGEGPWTLPEPNEP